MAKQWVLVEGLVYTGPRPDNTLPGDLPGGTTPPGGGETPPPDPNAPHPEHPIVLPPEGGGAPPVPTHPIYLPPYPAHPIVLPPEGGGETPPPDPNAPHPDHTLPGDLPDGTWGGAGEPCPTPPIVIVPPQGELPEIPDDKWLVVIMTPDGELEWALIPAGGPPGNLPPAVQPV